MNQTDLAVFNQAINLAQSGQKQVAYAQLKTLTGTNPYDPTLLLWIAFSTPDLREAGWCIDQISRIDPANSSLAGARKWLSDEMAKQVPPTPPAFMESAPVYNAAPPVQPYYPNPPYQGYAIPQQGYAAPNAQYYSGAPIMMPPRQPAMHGGIVFLIFLGYLVVFWIASITIMGIGAYSLVLLISFGVAIGATVETVQRRSTYGKMAGSHPIVVFVLVLMFGAFALALYMADFHRFQSRKKAGWFAQPRAF